MVWRYLPPNAVTALSIVFAVVSIEEAVSGRPVAAAWWGLLPVMTDKLDGLLAKLLKGGSDFGVQLDSLADMMAFGAVPATVFWAFYSARPELGWADGWPRLVLRLLCGLYVIAAAARLARFNVMTARAGHAAHYRGVPSTMTAGLLLSLFLTALKYADPALRGAEQFDHLRLLGPLRLDPLVRHLPLLLPLAALGMLSPLRVPKLGRTFSRVTDAILGVAVAFALVVGVSRRLPEYLCGGGLYYLGICIAYHLRTAQR